MFHPRSSCRLHCQTLHSSLEPRTESLAAAWQRTHNHLLPPGGVRHTGTLLSVQLLHMTHIHEVFRPTVFFMLEHSSCLFQMLIIHFPIINLHFILMVTREN